MAVCTRALQQPLNHIHPSFQVLLILAAMGKLRVVQARCEADTQLVLLLKLQYIWAVWSKDFDHVHLLLAVMVHDIDNLHDILKAQPALNVDTIDVSGLDVPTGVEMHVRDPLVLKAAKYAYTGISKVKPDDFDLFMRLVSER